MHINVKQTVVAIPAGASTQVVPANGLRSYLRVVNIGAGNVNLGFGAAAVVDSGYPLDAASGAGRRGGELAFDTELVPVGSITAWSAAGTNLVVLEG